MHRKIYWIGATVAMVAVGFAVYAAKTKAGSTTNAPPAYVAKIAERLAKDHGDATPTSAMAVSTTRGPAEQVVVAGAGVGSPGTRVWLVVLHGHFQDPGASLPSGDPIPTGSIISFTINKQSHHIMDFGIGDRSPNLLSLGQVKSIGRANFSPARSTVSLILAEPDFAPNFGDPLWGGWPGDSPRLRMLARAIGQARRLGTVKSIAGLQDSFWPLVQLGYGNGRVVPLTWDAGSTVAIQLPDGRWQLLKSAFLARVLRNPRSTFSNTPRSRVTSGPNGRATVIVGNLPGLRALLYMSPSNGGGGKETAPAGSILIARMPVVDGQIHWQGTVRLPPRDAAKGRWSLTLIVRPFPQFSVVSGESLGLPWPHDAGK